MNIITRIINKAKVRCTLACMLLAIVPAASAFADVTINIGGNVYGGGRQGAVGTGNTTATNNTSVNSVTITGNTPVKVTDVTVYEGTIEGDVFGGGKNGRSYGGTEVTVNGGTIEERVFGAGEGSTAVVFGYGNLTITGGEIQDNVYGGGNEADLIGSATVKLQGGSLKADVYGGSRIANIYGYTFIDIDGANAKNNLIIKNVYGGNDISGVIESSNNWAWTNASGLQTPFDVNSTAAINAYNTVGNTWNAFIRSTASSTYKIFIGKLYGGGNGDYNYLSGDYAGKTSPEIERAYLQIEGGNFGYLMGGGNNATVTESTDIFINNSSGLVTLTQAEFESTGISQTAFDVTTEGNVSTYTAKNQFDGVFGGNDRAEMRIRPNWYLNTASINNLYSGGNAGKMTYYYEDTESGNKGGIFLELNSSGLTVENVYGGCRKADVQPTKYTLANNVETSTTSVSYGVETIDGVAFPANHAARVLIKAGKVKNVYGGNDVSGIVYGGNAVAILSTIDGDVYGGGNGNYPYTDNQAYANNAEYSDYLFEVPTNKTAIEALNDFRPNAENVWLYVAGTAAEQTIIGGSLYVGGNSATLRSSNNDATAKLKLGAYVTADKVFLGSNGEHLTDGEMMAHYYANDANYSSGFSSVVINNNTDFNAYMQAADVFILPTVEFDNMSGTNKYTTNIGSFYVGGNAGSMSVPGTITMNFNQPINIYSRLVGGSNQANVSYTSGQNTVSRVGGLLQTPSAGNSKLIMNFRNAGNGGLHLIPKKLVSNAGVYSLAWNTETLGGKSYYKGANIYGGCFESGIVQGPVEMNFETSVLLSDNELFKIDQTDQSGNAITKDQQLYVFSKAMSVFGGGYGENTNIQGTTTINIADANNVAGTTTILKAFGGGLEGTVTGNTTINLTAGNVGKIYGGGFEGDITGNTRVYLDGGTVVDAFAGACNADISGYAQLFMGAGSTPGFTNVTENVYGGNDYGGTINGTNTDLASVNINLTSDQKAAMIYKYSAGTAPVLQSSSYVEYRQGSVNKIFGGSRGDYTYSTQSDKPYLQKSFVNFRPTTNASNSVTTIFGASQGVEGYVDGTEKDQMQQSSYVLVNIPDGVTSFAGTDVFGAGEASGVGMFAAAAALGRNNAASDNYSAVVDMISGRVKDVYGASRNEGITRRTVVNVPAGSTAYMDRIFGGGYGRELATPCDTYESNVNWNSALATVGWYQDGIYGGNNNSRRTLYAIVNINAPVYSVHPHDDVLEQYATAYGAGCGPDTWAQYTEVNLGGTAQSGAQLYEVYGGGKQGRVLNLASLNVYQTGLGAANLPLGLGSGYTDQGLDGENTLALNNKLGFKTNTNVNINLYANVSGYMYNGALSGAYAYAGGLGNKQDRTDVTSGSVCGTTYIGLHGGKVAKDIYAGGTNGSVMDYYNVGSLAGSNDPVAQTYAYIEGGTVRNVYGGGWRGSVGYHNTSTNDLTNDIPGKSNVIIGKLGIPEEAGNDSPETKDSRYLNGRPSITRNVYGGGEGGQIYGLTNLVIYDGRIGYRYNSDTHQYVAELDDDGNPDEDDNLLATSGNAFGGGYVANSSVDESSVRMYGGQIRTSLYGGGEIATIGRGTMNGTTPVVSKYGLANVRVYAGKILGSVFGGGRGEDNWGGSGYMTKEEETWMDLTCQGYVFGKTRVWIHGGQIGNELTVEKGEGNVFGGGNLGYVYGENVKNESTGYYYVPDGNGDPTSTLTEDCCVIIEPLCLVLDDIDEQYVKGTRIGPDVLNTWAFGNDNWSKIDHTGISIGNAVFAGGNVSRGSDRVFANTPTVFGNATASVLDVFARDFISIGEDGIGGLYGDGNLTLVDGYRELNITNYGTDYHYLQTNLTLDQYNNELNDRQRAYYELKYKLKDWPEGVIHDYSYTESRYMHEYTYHDDTENADITILFRRGQKITAAQYDKYKIADDEDEVLMWRTGSKRYRWDDQVTENEYDLMDEVEKANWDLYGFCTLYLGRMINTIQRADFCGVFGSRIVMRGSLDRATDVADYTNYTINRVDEVSLNTEYQGEHEQGNYFGIYSVVNYLGALTSDVWFDEVRKTSEYGESGYSGEYTTGIKVNGDDVAYGTSLATYSNWKDYHINSRKRNNGKSRNEVALASGVWLEIVDKETEQHRENKTYGPITGVVELNLINVAPGEGGGYVYAKNEHHPVNWEATRNNVVFRTKILAESNRSAVSTQQLVFTGADPVKMQTTGNFVNRNSDKRIVDDCYPNSGAYTGDDAAPAHYWYIRGDFYVYEQTISAYTGTALAYPEKVSIPLTITPESQGKLVLSSIKKNLTAFWTGDVLPKYQTAEEGVILINNKTYRKNDPISYWEWSLLTEEEQQFFVEEDTYVCAHDVTLSSNILAGNEDKTYKAGDILTSLPALSDNNKSALDLYVCVQAFDNYSIGDVVDKEVVDDMSRVNKNKFVRPFNPTNAVNHDNGFLLTFKWDNPDSWSTYYQYSAAAPSGTDQYVRSDNPINNYLQSPTFRCIEDGLYGQREYSREDIIDYETFNTKPDDETLESYSISPQSLASFEKVYMALEDFSFKDNQNVVHDYQSGSLITATEYATLSSYQSKFEEAKLCIKTYEVSKDEHYLNGLVYPVSTYNSLTDGLSGTELEDVEACFSDAYICTKAGSWGGSEFKAGQNYQALKYSNLSSKDRQNFIYNYDALDLLSEDFVNTDNDETLPDNEKIILNYQGNAPKDATQPALGPIIPVADQIPFAMAQSIDYQATYNLSTPLKLKPGQSVKVNRGGSTVTLSGVAENHTDYNRIIQGDVLANTVYEDDLRNEQSNYSPIIVKGEYQDDKVFHVVMVDFHLGNVYYTKGQVVEDTYYNDMDADIRNSKFKDIRKTEFPEYPSGAGEKTYYFCSKAYEALTSFTDIDNQHYNAGSTVPVGTIISDDDDLYSSLENQQKGFSIDGKVPTETSTLYVSRETDINQLSKDMIVTVMYIYDYVESYDEESTSYSTIRERHIVNVRIKFESGLPTIGVLGTPSTVMPGTTLSLKTPDVTRGAFETMGGGWEVFKTEDEALAHLNGKEFTINGTPLYWYQDSAWLAYYSMSYLGKAYSNPVRLSVANYHRMADVMSSTHDVVTEITDNIPIPDTDPVEYETVVVSTETNAVPDYMYLNKAKGAERRMPKVYVGSSSELAALSSFFNASKEWEDDPEYESIYNLDNIDFILDNDITYQEETAWTPIATRGEGDNSCFEGNLHGDGHTVSGLTNSLFDYLCGDVYNIGVTGTFSTAGIANYGDGKVVNSWTYSTNTNADFSSVHPIVGNGGGIVVNSYYYNNYNSDPVDGHETYKMSRKDFLDGKVAYNLNRYYLDKRYYDNVAPSGDNNYYYWQRSTALMPATPENASTRVPTAKKYPTGYEKYVEKRYENIDFTYAGGTVPENIDIRQVSKENKSFYPVYPDDYIFFGQALTYDILPADAAHEYYPGPINRADYKLLASNADRVFRAPGYYGASNNIDLVYFNKNARFAKQYDGTDIQVLNGRGLTAIDFTYQPVSGWPSGYTDNKSQATYYSPIKDDNSGLGLASFKTAGITKNLLVYADPVGDAPTHTVLADALTEPEYVSDNTHDYGIVKVANSNNVAGHLVSLDNSASSPAFKSDRNHFLVDKEDFNAPFEYTFDNINFMWYQRTPDGSTDRYVETDVVNDNTVTYGWQTISLPFSADLVTTNQKGEITHFYNYTDAENGIDESIGHEYWLREFGDVTSEKDAENHDVFTTVFHSPAADSDNDDKLVTNQYLWDNYYSKSSRRDGNEDYYKHYEGNDNPDKDYYHKNRTYTDYPLFTEGKPYLIGFPGGTFYEFDLSGVFNPTTVYHGADADYITVPDKQTITFVSENGTTIRVSDTQYSSNTEEEQVGENGPVYTFNPSYQSIPLAAGSGYLLNSDAVSQPSSKFVNNNAAVTTVPFRPYFTYTAPSGGGSGAANRAGTRADVLYIGYAGNDDSDPIIDMVTNHGLFIYSENMTIVIESTLQEATDVTITNTAGSTLKRLTVQPGTKEIIPVNSRGIYIVNRQKVAVTR